MKKKGGWCFVLKKMRWEGQIKGGTTPIERAGGGDVRRRKDEVDEEGRKGEETRRGRGERESHPE